MKRALLALATLTTVAVGGAVLGRRHRRLAGPNAAALPDEERERVHSPIRGEIDQAVERAVAAGAKAPLAYMGAGAEGVVFCDPTGKAFKVGRRLGRGDDSLATEAAFFRKANQVPAIARNVARFYRYDRDQDVIVRECIREERTKHGDRRHLYNADTKAWDTAERIHRAMLPYGFTGPERKTDSFVYVRGRGMVLVDGGFAHKVGRELVKDVLDKIHGRVPRGPFENDEALAYHVRWERGGTVPKEIADRLRARLGDKQQLDGLRGAPRGEWTVLCYNREAVSAVKRAAKAVGVELTYLSRAEARRSGAAADTGYATVTGTAAQMAAFYDAIPKTVTGVEGYEWRALPTALGRVRRTRGLAAPRVHVVESQPWLDIGDADVVQAWAVEDEDEIDGVELRSKHDPAHFALAHRTSKRHAGDKWQVTWFRDGKPTGDAREDTLAKALDNTGPYEYEVVAVHTRAERRPGRRGVLAGRYRRQERIPGGLAPG